MRIHTIGLAPLMFAAFAGGCVHAARAPQSGPADSPEGVPATTTAVQAGVARYGAPVQGRIGGADRHAVEIEIPASTRVRLVIEQRDIDLSVWLYDPAGTEVKRRWNSMKWRDAPEVFEFEAAAVGTYRLEIAIFEWEDSTRIGAYEVRVAEQLTSAEYAAQQSAAAVQRDGLADTVATWLASAAVPVATAQPGSDHSDLEPLRDILRAARIVALGEATHGTREFFQLKHRLVEFIVTQMGFTHFAMEIPYAEALRINEYVLHGVGDATQALVGTGFTVWFTEEVLALIEWMRAHNATLPLEQRVRFVGLDIQSQTAAAEQVLGYISRVAPEHLPAAEEALAPIHPQPAAERYNIRRRSAAEKADAQRRLYALIGYLASQEASLTRASSVQEYRDALQSARTLQEYDRYTSLTFREQHERGFEVRDRAMADNAAQLLRDGGPAARMVLWAHNGHLDMQYELYGAAQMGRFLKQAFGDEYYGLGLTFDHGSFRAHGVRPDGTRGWTEFTVGAAPANWLEWYLARAPHPIYLLDIRTAPSQGAVRRWLESELPYRSVGAAYNPSPEFPYDRGAALARRFDGVIFVRSTTAARSLQLPSPTR
jgi:erythromycin esterase